MVQAQQQPAVSPSEFYQRAHEAALEIYQRLQQPGEQIDSLAIAELAHNLYFEQRFSDEVYDAFGLMSVIVSRLELWFLAVGIEVGELRAHC